MADMEIDSLKIEIASSSSEAEQSLYRLTQSLVVLRNTLGGLNFKSNGLNAFANSLRRLGRTTKDYDPKSINQIITSMKELANVTGDVSSIATFTKSINSITRSADKIKQTATVFPELSKQLQEFFNAMAGADISDNTVRMAEALAEITKHGARASATIDEFNKSSNRSIPVMQSLSRSADVLINALKRIGGGAISGIKNLVTQLMNLGKTSNSVSGLTFNLKSLLATVIGFRGITGLFNWAKESVSAGAELTEIDHIVESVFGKDMVNAVQEWADGAIDSFGIAGTAAKKYAGTMSAMFQASNVGIKESNKMSMELVKLAGDLSAFYNIDTETAYNKLKSGMAGMVRPLRDLGIDLSAATLKEYALAQGIEKSYSAMTQGEKMMLRYKFLMEQTSTQTDDFRKTADSLANAMRTLRAYASEVAVQIGAGLGSAIRHVVVWLNSLMKYVLKAAQAFAIFMQTLFGKYKGGAGGVNLDGALLDAEDSASDLADSAEDAASGIGSADDAAKKLKKDLAVLPFDELNQLAKDQESTSSGSGGSGGGGGGLGDLGDFGEGIFGDALDNMSEKLGEFQSFVDKWAKKIKKAFDAKDWEGLGQAIAWGLNKGIDKLYEILDPQKVADKIDPFLDAFSTTFNSLVNAIHFKKLGQALGNGINILVHAANRLIDPKTGIDFKNIGKKLAEGFNGLVGKVKWRELGNLFGNKFMISWDMLKGFASELKWSDVGRALGTTLNGINDKIRWKDVSDALTASLNGAFDALKEFSATVEWYDIATNLADGVNKGLRDFKWKENGETLNKFLQNLLDALITFVDRVNWYDLGKGIGDFLSEIEWGKALKKAAKAFITAFQGLICGMVDTPAGAFVVALGGALATVKVLSAVNSFTANIATALTGTESVGVVSSALTSLFSSASSGVAPGLAGITAAVTPVAGAVAAVAIGIGFAEAAGNVAEANITRKFANIERDANNITEKINNLDEDTKRMVQEAKTNAEADARLVEPWIKKIEALEGKTNLTAQEQAEYNEAVEKIIEVFPELSGAVDETTGHFTGGSKSVRDYVDNLKNIAIAEVYLEKSKDAARNLVEAEETLATAQRNLNGLEGQHRDLLLTKEKVLKNSVNGYIDWNGKLTRSKDLLDDLNQQIEENEMQQDAAKSAVEAASKAHSDANTKYEQYAKGYQTYTQNMASATSELDGKIKTTEQTTGSVFSNMLSKALSLPIEMYNKIAGSTDENPAEAVSKMFKDAQTKEEEGAKALQTAAEEIPKGMGKSVDDNINTFLASIGKASTEAHKKFLTDNQISSPSKKYEESAKHIPEGMAKGVEGNKQVAITAIGKLVTDMASEFTRKTTGSGGLSQKMFDGGKKVTSEFIRGLKTKGTFSAESYFKGYFTDSLWKSLSSIGDTFYKKGKNIATQFANGLKSVSIPVPEIDVSSWTPWSVQTATETINFSIPNFSAGWRYYAKGGLFTKALPGILGEAGDEAAIPLENEKTMRRIAKAIVDNSDGSFGMSEEQLASAVARGYVQAMMSNHGNERPLNVYATLYTEDNEVLARAVQRGNQSMDYRNNATPQLG